MQKLNEHKVNLNSYYDINFEVTLRLRIDFDRNMLYILLIISLCHLVLQLINCHGDNELIIIFMHFLCFEHQLISDSFYLSTDEC